MKNSQTFDWAIIGAGASGLHLLYELLNSDTNKQLSVLLIDSGDRSTKSWCFWTSQQKHCLPFLVEKSWDNMEYTSSNNQRKVASIAPYAYQFISSEGFFAFFFDQFIPNDSRITWVSDWVMDLHEETDGVQIHTQAGDTYFARQVADSRRGDFTVDPNAIKQHFKGKVVAFEQPILVDNCLTLMDFSLNFSSSNAAVFHYILPFSKTEALIETTVFTENHFNADLYEEIWATYMKEKFGSFTFQVLSEEEGTIPMILDESIPTNSRITKIGIAGGKIKPSTGYAFSRMQEHAKAIASGSQLKKPKRFTFYDRMLLRVMQNEMEQIPKVMDRLFDRVPFPDILKFLDDKTELKEEIRLLSKLDIPLFLKHLIR